MCVFVFCLNSWEVSTGKTLAMMGDVPGLAGSFQLEVTADPSFGAKAELLGGSAYIQFQARASINEALSLSNQTLKCKNMQHCDQKPGHRVLLPLPPFGRKKREGV